MKILNKKIMSVNVYFDLCYEIQYYVSTLKNYQLQNILYIFLIHALTST